VTGSRGIKTRYRAFDASWNFIDGEKDTFGNLWLDRFNLKLALPRADLIIGRQAITFGKAYFWNPLDLYLPFDPAQFDRDYKAGVDALRLDIPLGPFSGLNLIYVLGRELDINNQYVQDGNVSASWFGSSLLLRGFTHADGWDLAVQGSKVYGVDTISGVDWWGNSSPFRSDSRPLDSGPMVGPCRPRPMGRDC